MLNTEASTDNLSIKQIIASDLRKYAEEMNISERQLINDFARNTNVAKRTLERILVEDQKSNAHVRTVVDIYSQIYNATTLTEVISKAPIVVSEYIKKNHSQCTGKNPKVSEISQNPAQQAEFTSSTVFNQIYMMTSGDFGTDLEAIRENFGQNGLKHLDEMIKLGFVEIDVDDHVTRKKPLTWDRTIRKNFIKTIINDLYKEENADLENPNYIGVAIGDVTPEDYNLIREKMRNHYTELMTILNQSKPTYKDAIRITFAKVMEKIEFKVEGDKLC